jgi:hypothetical protein
MQNEELVIVKAAGIYSYHLALKGVRSLCPSVSYVLKFVLFCFGVGLCFSLLGNNTDVIMFEKRALTTIFGCREEK